MNPKCPKCGSRKVGVDPNNIGMICHKCEHKWQLEIDDIMTDKPTHTPNWEKIARQIARDLADIVQDTAGSKSSKSELQEYADGCVSDYSEDPEYHTACNGYEANQKVKLAAKKFVNEFERAVNTGEIFAKGLPAQMLMGDAIIFAKELQAIIKQAGEDIS